jgi:hypothetical protein
MMTGKQYLMGIAGGALLGGFINGITALANGRNFLTGTLATPKHTMPDLSSLVKPELPKAELQGPAQKPLAGMDNSTPVVNSKGVPYPDVEVPGYGKIPFPEGPYTPNNAATLRTPFNQSVRAEFKNWWLEQGRPLPNGPIEIHHIQPLQYGGNNSFLNLVPLSPQVHREFTTWWMTFKMPF